MRHPRVLLGIVAAAIPTSGAVAGDSARDEARLRKLTAGYGACVVRKHHAAAMDAVLSTASNREIIGPRSQIIDSDCLVGVAGSGVDMHFPNDTYQYVLADALVNADLRDKQDATFEDRLPLAQPPFPPDEAQGESSTIRRSDKQQKAMHERRSRQFALAWLSRYGECIVRQDPADARYWLLTPPGTPEETSRIKALQPAFSACVGPGTMHFNRVSLRGTVAVNYYRLAMATVISPVGSHS